MAGLFTEKVVLVTGAGRGIGRAVATAYVEAGARVVFADRDAQLLDEATAQLSPDSVTTVVCDVRQAEAVTRLAETAAARFGRIDILINNAGIGIWKSPLELTVEEWDAVLETNLRGAFLCAREVAKRMPETGGAIVNIASTRALMSEPNSEAYAASKGGIVALTHALAVSLGSKRIRVNCISPGWIETGDYGALTQADHAQHPAGRVGRPSDVARACFYLTDPANDFLTGVNLVLDGGMTRKMIYIE
ncbi:SDR family NAD(P)-dependent oxidoreductase [Alicyclobacillus kakegawensis]|uniref:SDR family NAD(P)-dependent oxidoreductase n=1 Tax=Alicyclobacillus kakegawensis TaxID=392012 RepID=UPI0008313DFA|nr:SDR family oxidoreductase [Alicyclobacillus kakegawensis]